LRSAGLARSAEDANRSGTRGWPIFNKITSGYPGTQRVFGDAAMSLAGIGSGLASSLNLTGSLNYGQQLSSLQRQGGASGLANDTVSLSGQGQFLNQLQALKASDPQKFKEVMTQASRDLQAAAQQAGNTSRGQNLSELAKKFQDVANGGDITQLKPTTYSNRVQRAYGSHQPGGMQELLNSLGQGASTSSGPDPHNVVKNALSSLNKL
jgi:hypothetical protein